ncbi:hypothetical protein T484DRAFT_1861996, partial [Baffinella frigidus]
MQAALTAANERAAAADAENASLRARDAASEVGSEYGSERLMAVDKASTAEKQTVGAFHDACRRLENGGLATVEAIDRYHEDGDGDPLVVLLQDMYREFFAPTIVGEDGERAQRSLGGELEVRLDVASMPLIDRSAWSTALQLRSGEAVYSSPEVREMKEKFARKEIARAQSKVQGRRGRRGSSDDDEAGREVRDKSKEKKMAEQQRKDKAAAEKRRADAANAKGGPPGAKGGGKPAPARSGGCTGTHARSPNLGSGGAARAQVFKRAPGQITAAPVEAFYSSAVSARLSWWRRAGADKSVLRQIRDGVKVDFACSPKPFKRPPIKVDSGDEQWVRDELAKQDALGAFGPAVPSAFISPAFVVHQ